MPDEKPRLEGGDVRALSWLICPRIDRKRIVDRVGGSRHFTLRDFFPNYRNVGRRFDSKPHSTAGYANHGDPDFLAEQNTFTDFSTED